MQMPNSFHNFELHKPARHSQLTSSPVLPLNRISSEQLVNSTALELQRRESSNTSPNHVCGRLPMGVHTVMAEGLQVR